MWYFVDKPLRYIYKYIYISKKFPKGPKPEFSSKGFFVKCARRSKG